MLSRVFNNADIMSQVLQNFDSMKPLGLLASTSRSMNNTLCKSDTGRKNWLDIGVNITVGEDGFEEADVRKHFDVRTEQDFFLNLKLLVCPWSSQPLFLPVAAERSGHRKVCFLKGDDDHLLFFPDGMSLSQRIPARPCAGYEEKVQRIDGFPKLDTLELRYKTQRMSALALEAHNKLLVPDFSNDRGSVYKVFRIHQGVFAVVEVFSREFDVDGLGDHGIYFFAHKDKRFLRHIVWKKNVDISDCAILSKPTELWMMGSDGIEYYGRVNGPRMVEDVCAEFVDPAFWMMGRGDAKGAIAYMKTTGIPLDTSCLVTHCTLLHYAAAEGYIDGIRLLLAEGFRMIDYDDYFGHTALGVAVANLHFDVVEVLLKEAGASVSAGSYIFTEMGEFVKYRSYTNCRQRANAEIEHLVPGIVRLLLDAEPDILKVDLDVDVTNNCSILSSPEAIRMIMATGYAANMSWVVTAFREFRTRIHELSAISSLQVLVRDFGLTFNEKEDVYVFTPPLLYLVRFAVAEVIIFAIDHLRADPKVLDCAGIGIRQIAAHRPAGDPETLRLLTYLGSRGL